MADTGCPDPGRLTELALGELVGRDRSELLDHLARCPSCRDHVQDLVEASEMILAATTEGEPPIGFETAVFEAVRVGQAAQASEPSRRTRIALAMVAIAAAVAAVGFVVGALVSNPSPAVREAVMVTDTGRDVGQAWRHSGEPAWVFVSVPQWSRWEDPAEAANQYALLATLDDGRQIDLGPVTFRADGTWGTITSTEPAQIEALAVVDQTGRVWCRGEF